MKKIINGITYSFNRNIGWQDRTLRTIIGFGATIGVFYFMNSNLTYSILLGILAVAQFGTVFSARCIICFFAGQCTIDNREKRKLETNGVVYEKETTNGR